MWNLKLRESAVSFQFTHRLQTQTGETVTALKLSLTYELENLSQITQRHFVIKRYLYIPSKNFVHTCFYKGSQNNQKLKFFHPSYYSIIWDVWNRYSNLNTFWRKLTHNHANTHSLLMLANQRSFPVYFVLFCKNNMWFQIICIGSKSLDVWKFG